MAITLGEIAVRLTANTAEFVSGFGSASTTAKRFRADISEHIGAVGNVLEQGLAQFGEFGASVGGVLGRASAAAGQAILSFGRLGGSMGTIVGVGAGAVAALAVAEAGIIGVAIHSAQGAAKLGEMSEKAGVSSQTLAGLGLAGKGVGVEIESLVKALGFMGANAVKAAISSDYAHTAFGRLGVNVKDAGGHLKDGGQLFLEVVGKINALPTQEQGFFVKQIFGRGGLEILPLINKGVDEIAGKMELASKLGLGDAETVAASRQFKETVDEISAAFEGMGLRLAKDLLPVLNEIVVKIAEWGKSGALSEFIDGIAGVVRFTLAAAAAVGDLGSAIKGVIAIGIGKTGLFKETAEGISQGGLSGGWDAFKKHFTTIGGNVTSAGKDFYDLMNPPATVIKPSRPLGSGADLTPKGEGKEDTTLARINDRIDALHREAASWALIAQAGSQGESLIAQATEKANAEFAKQVDLADKDKTGRAQKRIAEAEATLKADVANTFYAQTFSKINDELAKQDTKLKEQTKSTLASASAQGLAAISTAAISEQLSSERATIDKVVVAYDKLIAQDNLFRASKAKLGGASGPPEGQQADPNTLALFRDEMAKNAAALSQLTADKQQVAAAGISKELNLETQAADRLTPAINAVNAAYFKSADAVRAAKIELQLAQFAEDAARKGVDPTSAAGIALIEQKRAALQRADEQAYQGALAQESLQFNILAQYDEEIVKLQRVADLMRNQGVSTLGVEAQIFDEQNRLIHQWDEWALKVGTFKQKFQAVMGELIIQGRNAGQAIAGAFLTAIDGVETGLAKLLTGQKADFKAVFQNLAESVTKAEIQKGVGKLAEHIPGLGGLLKGTGPLGSSKNNPMFVAIVGAAPDSVPFGKTNPFGGGFGIGSDANPDQHSGIGGFFSGIASLFGGFHASGGSIPSGKWGITGEQGPELVQGPASVTPAGQTYNITHNHNYPNAGSRDLFGRTQKQNQARQMRNMRMAYGF